MARFNHTQGLFFETAVGEKPNVRYTLRPEDKDNLPSLHKLYLEEEDVTEHRFATKYLNGWDHWEVLLACSWFKEYISLWRRDLSARLASKAMNQILLISREGTEQNRLNASKYLLETLGKAPGSLKHRKATNLSPKPERTSEALEGRKIEEDFIRMKGLN